VTKSSIEKKLRIDVACLLINFNLITLPFVMEEPYM